MLSRQFQARTDPSAEGERAEAAHALGRAYLYSDLDRIAQGEMERAMVRALDDPSPLVRRALAEALASAAHAPHHVVAALVGDVAEIAAVVLGRSPILTDAELVDAVRVGDALIQGAIAARPGLSAAVGAALAECAGRETALALALNAGATPGEEAIRRIVARFGHDGEIRRAIGARSDLSTTLRHELVVKTAEVLRDHVVERDWVTREQASRMVGEAGDRATIVLARFDDSPDGDDDRLAFAGYLRGAGHLTPALLLRAVLSGHAGLFAAALSELSGQALARVTALVRHHHGLGFSALYRTTGLPAALLPAIRAALDVQPRDPSAPALRREVVAHVLEACGIDRGSPVPGLTALMRRFEAEAVRDETRAAAAIAPLAPIALPRDFRAHAEPILDLRPELAAA